jgi:hypothetical protein
MTSFAFIFGVLPLALSSGAGAGGQNAIGWAVVGGMLSATVLAIFFVPLFFLLVKRVFKQDKAGSGQDRDQVRNDDNRDGGHDGNRHPPHDQRPQEA